MDSVTLLAIEHSAVGGTALPDYTFQSLSDADFEDLVCDLLRASLKRQFQSFTAGRDGGIDLLIGARIWRSIVVQCKHFWRSGFAKLKTSLKKQELPKIAKLRPKRYILATSVGLTPDNKAELLALLAPYCLGIDDIYGRDDLNALLRAHSDVETAHFKLWLTSIPVLQRILHQGMAVWNALTQSEIERKMSLYVQTDAYRVALDILGKHNYCIISGIPGIGKTTLAQILLTRLMEADVELIAVRDDIGEAFESLDLNKRQVVYYDDFLGQSSLAERLGKNEDRSILRLLQEAKRSKLLKVILTTREYILNDARRLYEPLARPEFDVAKCIVKIDDYTRGRRARILYNHLYFSDLPSEYVATIAKNRTYRVIVDHKNYNPRLIEWMTSAAGVQGIPAQRFVDEFVRTLNDPLHIWKHAFDHQIGEDGQLLLLCLASVADTMALEDLQVAWAAALSPPVSPPLTRNLRNRFSTALKHLDGSFVRTERGHDETGVSFHNPSIRDYVTRRIATDDNLRRELLTSSQFFEQVSSLVHLGANGQIQHSPGIHVGDCILLRDAVRRTFGARSPVLRRLARMGGEAKLGRLSLPDLSTRLSIMAAWANAFGAAWLEFVCELVSEQTDTGTFAKTARADACPFLEAVIRQWPASGGKWAPLIQRYIAAIGDHITDCLSPDDWRKWSRFVQENSGLFTEEALDDWHDRASTFCTNEIEVIFDNADSASDAESWFEDLEAIAKVWGFSLDEGRGRLEDWVAEHGEREESDYEWRGGGDSGPAARERGDADDDLDVLFGTLMARDQP